MEKLERVMSCSRLALLFLAFVSNHLGASFNSVHTLLKKYKRPITVLIASMQPDQYALALEIADSYDSTVVIIESHTAPLLSLISQKDYPNVVVLSSRVTDTKLKRLSECEHFDVAILGEQLLSMRSEYVKHIMHYITALADHHFLVFPHNEKKRESNCYRIFDKNLRLENGVIAEQNNLFETWYVPGKRRTLTRVSWLRNKKSKNVFEIESDFEKKHLIKKKRDRVLTSDWKPGINLVTYKCLSGIYPSSESLLEKVRATQCLSHNDWAPHNMLVQGQSIELIDFDDVECLYRWAWPEKDLSCFVMIQDIRMLEEFFFYVKKYSWKQVLKRMKNEKKKQK